MWRLALVAACALSAGCVISKVSVRSDPGGAVVYLDGEKKGITPCTFKFDFYGTRELKLERDGYQTRRELVKLKPPLYARFPLDIIFDLLLPLKITDKHNFTYTLSPIEPTDTDALLRRAEELRQEAIKPE